MIFNHKDGAADLARARAKERGEQWAVWQGGVHRRDFIAAPAHPAADFPFPGGAGCWAILEGSKTMAIRSAPANSKFQRGSGVYECRCCGKRTRETGSGESGSGLCADCFNDAGLENEHSDGHHDDEPKPGCPQCNASR